MQCRWIYLTNTPNFTSSTIELLDPCFVFAKPTQPVQLRENISAFLQILELFRDTWTIHPGNINWSALVSGPLSNRSLQELLSGDFTHLLPDTPLTDLLAKKFTHPAVNTLQNFGWTVISRDEYSVSANYVAFELPLKLNLLCACPRNTSIDRGVDVKDILSKHNYQLRSRRFFSDLRFELDEANKISRKYSVRGLRIRVTEGDQPERSVLFHNRVSQDSMKGRSSSLTTQQQAQIRILQNMFPTTRSHLNIIHSVDIKSSFAFSIEERRMWNYGFDQLNSNYIIVVVSTDRLTRRPSELEELFKQLRDKSIILVAGTEVSNNQVLQYKVLCTDEQRSMWQSSDASQGADDFWLNEQKELKISATEYQLSAQQGKYALIHTLETNVVKRIQEAQKAQSLRNDPLLELCGKLSRGYSSLFRLTAFTRISNDRKTTNSPALHRSIIHLLFPDVEEVHDIVLSATKRSVEESFLHEYLKEPRSKSELFIFSNLDRISRSVSCFEEIMELATENNIQLCYLISQVETLQNIQKALQQDLSVDMKLSEILTFNCALSLSSDELALIDDCIHHHPEQLFMFPFWLNAPACDHRVETMHELSVAEVMKRVLASEVKKHEQFAQARSFQMMGKVATKDEHSKQERHTEQSLRKYAQTIQEALEPKSMTPALFIRSRPNGDMNGERLSYMGVTLHSCEE